MDYNEWMSLNPITKRKPASWSWLKFAGAVGVSDTMIDNYRHGGSTPTKDRLVNIANVLDMTPEELDKEFIEWRTMAHEN